MRNSSVLRNLPPCFLVAFVTLALAGLRTLPAQTPEFRRGDANADASVDISDPVFTLQFLFLGGDSPACLDAADGNDSGVLDLSDPVYILQFLFLAGQRPPAPGHLECGPDPTGDVLNCSTYGECPPVPDGDPVERSLTRLGFNISPTDRVGKDGRPLPAEFDPLGGTFSVGPKSEVFFMGFSPERTDGTSSSASISGFFSNESGRYLTNQVFDPDPADTPWASSGSETKITRTATAADTDGDGLEELFVISAEGGDLILRWIDQGTITSGTMGEGIVIDRLGDVEVNDIQAVSGDLHGNGVEYIVIVTSTEDSFRLHIVVRSGDGSFSPMAVAVLEPGEFRQGVLLTPISVSLDTGNVDGDPADEIALVLNEGFESLQYRGRTYQRDAVFPGFSSRLLLLDDPTHGLTELHSEQLGPDYFNSDLEDVEQVAGVSMGDIDSDGLDEVVVGWISNNFNGAFNNAERNVYRGLLSVMDDANHGFSLIRSRTFALGDDCSPLCDRSPHRSLYLPINVLNLDGDAAPDVQVGDVILVKFNGIRFTQQRELPIDPRDIRNFLDRSRSATAVGDVTGNGRDEVITFRKLPDPRRGVVAEVEYWEHRPGNVRLFRVLGTTTPVTEVYMTPVVVPVNIDGSLLRFLDSQQVFTQPILVAALAAPPCGRPGQVTHDCTTTFSFSGTETGEHEQSFTIEASAHIGASFSQSVFGTEVAAGEIKLTVSESLTTLASTSVQVTRSVGFTTGPNEDAVVVTTIPFDQYFYEIVGHTNPEREGERIIISLPRAPITLLLEREFYNRLVGEGGIQVDEAVFQHTIGDVDSYPGRMEKIGILDDHTGLEVHAAGVGAGTGSRTPEFSIVVTESDSRAYKATFGFSLEISLTNLGIMQGVEFSMESGQTVKYSKGTSTEYGGRVGQIDPDVFPAGAYSVGLFTYLYEDPATGIQFDVVNYWVE